VSLIASPAASRGGSTGSPWARGADLGKTRCAVVTAAERAVFNFWPGPVRQLYRARVWAVVRSKRCPRRSRGATRLLRPNPHRCPGSGPPGTCGKPVPAPSRARLQSWGSGRAGCSQPSSGERCPPGPCLSAGTVAVTGSCAAAGNLSARWFRPYLVSFQRLWGGRAGGRKKEKWIYSPGPICSARSRQAPEPCTVPADVLLPRAEPRPQPDAAASFSGCLILISLVLLFY